MKGQLLVVDDEAEDRSTLKTGLEHLGYQVEAVGSGQEALNMVRRTPLPDLIILDIMMDHMDGLETFRSLLESNDARVQRIPVLFLTNSEQHEVAAIGMGCADYVRKDSEFDVLVAHVENVLRRAKPRPFENWSQGPVLRLAFDEKRPVHITVSEAVDFVGFTKAEPDLEPARWRELMHPRNGAGTLLGVHLKDRGHQLWRDVFLQHEINTEFSKRSHQPRGGVSNLRLRIAGPRDYLCVPFEFLHDGTEYLAASYALSRSVLDMPRNTDPICSEMLDRRWAERKPLRILLIASNVHDAQRGIPPIPGVDQEIRALKSSLPRQLKSNDLPEWKVEVTVLPTEQATFSEVERQLKDCPFDIVHIAAHAHHDFDNPDRSGLLFWDPPGAGRYRVFSTHALSDLLRRSNVAFVFLSACEGAMSAAGHQLYAHDFLGLADAIVKAGVPAVLGYRWPIGDGDARTLAEKFYEVLGQQGELDVALLEARRALYRNQRPAWLSPMLVVQR